jgi:hypothetical protein
LAAVERSPFDELLIRWNDVPRDSLASLYLPEWDADTILQLAASRQHPNVLSKIDAHTLAIKLADTTFVPLPRSTKQGSPGLVTLTLPDHVRTGQAFHADFHQIDRLRERVNGSFRFMVPIGDETTMLPDEIRHLAYLRYVAQKRPAGNRWQGVLGRWTVLLADRVRALGGDPDKVPPSLTDPGSSKPRPDDVDCLTGKVRCLRYDCFGDFEGFVLETCDAEHVFATREPAVERVVHRACVERSRVTLRFDRVRRRIRGIEICCM